LKLKISDLEKIRKSSGHLDDIMTQYEEYINESGRPFCDYNMYRHKFNKISAKRKLMFGITRLCRIIKSFQTYAIQDLFSKALNAAKTRASIIQNRRKTQILQNTPGDADQVNQKSLLLLNIKIDHLVNIVEDQQSTIKHLKTNIDSKINKLLELQGVNPSSLNGSNSKPPVASHPAKETEPRATKIEYQPKIASLQNK